MTLVKRSVKGAALTAAEHDANADHFLKMANMVEGPNALILTPNERTRISRARQTITTVATMTGLAKSTLADGDVIEVEHYYDDALGGGGRFVWDQSSTATADGGAVIASDEGGDGRWLRLFDHGHQITFEMWGARQLTGFTDTYDSTAAINAAIAWLPNPSAPFGVYRQTYSILVTGCFGITDEIEWRYKNGVSMVGLAMQNTNSPGFMWVGDVATDKAMLVIGQSRYCEFRNLRFSGQMTDDVDAAQYAAIKLDSNITGSAGSQISERNRFSRIFIGKRDGFEDTRITPGQYQFKHGVVVVGTDTNCDFMYFEHCAIQTVEYSFYNPNPQATGWVLRGVRSFFVDHTLHVTATRIYLYNCETNANAKSAILVGNYVELLVEGHYAEASYGAFIEAVNSGAYGQITIRDSALDFNEDPETYPYFLDLETSGMMNIEIHGTRLFGANKIALGSPSAAKQVRVFNSDDVELVFSSPGNAQRIMLTGTVGPQRTPSGLADTAYAPFANLLHPVNEATPDYQRYDLPTDRVRLGNRFRGAALEIEAINVMLDEQTGGTITFEDMIPAGSMLFGVITQNIGASGATTYEVGDGTDQDRWGSVSGANMTSPGGANIADFADAGPVFVKADTPVVLTATSGAFSNATVLATALVATLKPRYYNPSNAQ